MTELGNRIKNLAAMKIAVIGLGISNIPLIRFLNSSGAKDITAYDKFENEQVRANIALLQSEGLIRGAVTGEFYLDEIANQSYDLIFKAPVIRPDLPQLVCAVENGSCLTSEMELFMELCPCKIYGVTGSDGKTTTTTLLWRLLSSHYAKYGRTVWLGGNIGRPLIDQLPVIHKEDAVVLELSSFQLMTLRKSPDVAIITNITPNHLDVHRDYAEYIAAKKNIYAYQSPSGVVVLNSKNEETRKLAEECFACGRRVRLFSAYQSAPDAFDHRAEGYGYYEPEKERLVFFSSLYNYSVERNLLRVPGLHNAENLLAALAACAGEICEEEIREALADFGGVEHRLEFVRELDGVRYYNSSIDSSPNRTIHTLSVLTEPVVLIAGGKDKNIPYDAIGSAICEKVRVLILTGPTAEKIEAAVKAAENYRAGSVTIYHFQTYQEAVKCAHDVSEPGDVVLLSPASTSFDLFRNFEERGNTFKALVHGLE